jgi:hypothetical protein
MPDGKPVTDVVQRDGGTVADTRRPTTRPPCSQTTAELPTSSEATLGQNDPVLIGDSVLIAPIVPYEDLILACTWKLQPDWLLINAAQTNSESPCRSTATPFD